ncbi:MAG TPA: hypothetical protein VIW46_12835 [Acidimicrobiia bacterium]|jgi:hypothetical protein
MLERLSPNTRTALRVAAGIAIAIAAGFGTLILLFVGGVTMTGCFIECGEPNPIGGSFLLAWAVLSASLSVTSAVWGVIGWRRRTLLRVGSAVAAIACLVIVTFVAVG